MDAKLAYSFADCLPVAERAEREAVNSREDRGARRIVGDGLYSFAVREPTLDRPIVQNRDVGHLLAV